MMCLGKHNCTWSSCSEGCTKEIFTCWQVSLLPVTDFHKLAGQLTPYHGFSPAGRSAYSLLLISTSWQVSLLPIMDFHKLAGQLTPNH